MKISTGYTLRHHIVSAIIITFKDEKERRLLLLNRLEDVFYYCYLFTLFFY